MLHYTCRGPALVASRTRVLLVVLATLVFAIVTLAPLSVRAQGYSVTFVVAGLPADLGTQYYVDSIPNGTIRAGETKSLTFATSGIHTVSVDLNVNVGNGTNYQCRDNVWSFSDGGSHTFVYKAQYYLEVLSPHGSSSGTGWYDEGTTVYARLAENVTAGPEGTRYVFVKWEEDASGHEIVSDPIVMDRARKAGAAWKTQYSLRIFSDPVGAFSPSILWFDADSVADFSAPQQTAETDTRRLFQEWAGDYSGTSVEGSLEMDGPKSVTAKYKTQYLLSITFVPLEVAKTPGMPNSTWYDAGQTAKLGPVRDPIPVGSGEQLKLISWNVDNMTQQGPSTDVPMYGPHHVKLIYQTQYYLRVVSALGNTTGTGWYPKGEKARFGVTYGGSEFPVKYTLIGWRLNSSNVIKDVPPTETQVTVDRPYVVEAVWNADYTPTLMLTLAIGSATVIVAAVSIVVVRRPGYFARLVSSLKSSLSRGRLRAPGAALSSLMPSVVCPKCGARIPGSAEFCQTCGAALPRGRITATYDLEAVDERIYDYIVKRHGEISLSRASKDLGLSVDEVKRSTERLKKKGRLA